MIEAKRKPWQQKWYTIIFESDSPSGRRFDVILLFAILTSLIVIMLESVPSLQQSYKGW